MNSLGKRLKSVPTPAWIVAGLFVLLIVPALMYGLSSDPEMVRWPIIAKIALAVLPCVFVVAYAALVGFIYADAKRRRMRHVLWTWLALVPYFVGVILYFIMRDPLPTPCPQCRTDVPRKFAFCPNCGASVHPTCSRCGKELQLEWRNCAHCGLPTTPPSAT